MYETMNPIPIEMPREPQRSSTKIIIKKWPVGVGPLVQVQLALLHTLDYITINYITAHI
jgi:hypothetical protein